MEFKCSSCAACCINAGIDGRMPDRGDGACIHLTEDFLCEIFETRPDICRAEKMYEKVKEIYPDVTYYEYCWKATKVCHMLIDLYNLDPIYKIDIQDYHDQLAKETIKKIK